MTTATSLYATPAQQNFLNKLLDEAVEMLRERDGLTGRTEADDLIDNCVSPMRPDQSTLKSEASQDIDTAKRNNAQLRAELTPLRDAAPAEQVQEFVSEVGMYRMGERIFKVLPSRSSDRHYAKELSDFHWEGETPVADHGGTLRFTYAKGAMYRLRPEHRMTPEQEREFGKLIGHCIDCGILLTHPKSIDWGKGPVCSDNYTH
jgi:hypothetical protein